MNYNDSNCICYIMCRSDISEKSLQYHHRFRPRWSCAQWQGTSRCSSEIWSQRASRWLISLWNLHFPSSGLDLQAAAEEEEESHSPTAHIYLIYSHMIHIIDILILRFIPSNFFNNTWSSHITMTGFTYRDQEFNQPLDIT